MAARLFLLLLQTQDQLEKANCALRPIIQHPPVPESLPPASPGPGPPISLPEAFPLFHYKIALPLPAAFDSLPSASDGG